MYEQKRDSERLRKDTYVGVNYCHTIYSYASLLTRNWDKKNIKYDGTSKKAVEKRARESGGKPKSIKPHLSPQNGE